MNLAISKYPVVSKKPSATNVDLRWPTFVALSLFDSTEYVNKECALIRVAHKQKLCSVHFWGPIGKAQPITDWRT